MMWRLSVDAQIDPDRRRLGLVQWQRGCRFVCHCGPLDRADQLAWQVAHTLLHLGFDHLRQVDRPDAWHAACDVVVARYLRQLQFGRPPFDACWPTLPNGDEQRLYECFRDQGVPEALVAAGFGQDGPLPVWGVDIQPWLHRKGYQTHWPSLLADGLTEAVAVTAEVAAGRLDRLHAGRPWSNERQTVRRAGQS